MAKRNVSTGMTRWEIILGGGLLAVYLFLLPLTADPLFDLAEKLFGVVIGEGVRDAAYYGILFALTLIAFGGYFVRTTRALLDHAGAVLGAVGVGLIAFYGLNEIVWRVLQLFSLTRTNLNDQAILTRLGDAPHSTILIVVLLAPVVEEAPFRGYIFGNLREVNRAAAYVVSGLLFAFPHVWPYVAAGGDPAYLLLILQYMAPALVMTWTCERAGSLWGSIFLHSIVNALAVWQAV